MGVFSGYCIALELASAVPYKTKKEIRQLITSHDGLISFTLNKKCRVLVTNVTTEQAQNTYKCRAAIKLNIPVVSVDFLHDCVRNGQVSNPEPFFILGKTKSQLFQTGVIPAPVRQSANNAKSKKTAVQINLNAFKVWRENDKNAPSFSTDYDIAKCLMLTKRTSHEFCVIELQVSTLQPKSASETDPERCSYRVATHVVNVSPKHSSLDKRESRYSKTVAEAVALYARVCRLFCEPPYNYVKALRPFPAFIGSAKFQLMQLSSINTVNSTANQDVIELINYIWKEATGQLDQLLAVPAAHITADQVEKAESVLLEIKQLLDGSEATNARDQIATLSDEFYKCLPHSNEHTVPIVHKQVIVTKQQLCQLLSDMISVSESTGWSDSSSTLSKYRALRCFIQPLTTSEVDYKAVTDTLATEPEMQILRIFRVSRPVEDMNFRSDIGNVQLLCHSSHVHNFVGILSRGLLLPKVVVDDLGGSRTDPGMLGHGIYFADSARTSAKYSRPSRCKNSRLMALCDVALGSSYETHRYETSLLSPPSGYDSVRGVETSTDFPSDFSADEYAIYCTDRQRIRYLVEFTMPGDNLVQLSLPVMDTDLCRDHLDDEIKSHEITLSDIQDVPNPLDSVKAGLVSSAESNAVPLRSVHVRARLVDLAAQVVVLQEYRNESDLTIEAKYVFPLDEFAVVCGFEAFINGKHVVGVVKEKETAHREYKQAVAEGHGAYLMDQDKESPDVFTVSVGNLPPKCAAVIKITYVAELPVDGEFINFRIPASVAPWTQQTALSVQTQDLTQSVKVKSCEDVSIHVAIEMPFDIRQIRSPTHKLRTKKTATKAVVEMAKNQSIGDGGFQLVILLAELHVPRMWVEQHPENRDSRACMLAFYPEFETSSSSDGSSAGADSFEVVFIVDLSNSMKGPPVEDAVKIVLLALHHLPSTCHFNIVAYGTDYDELFPSSRLKTSASVTSATAFIKTLKPTMGGSDLYRPLRAYHLLDRGSEDALPMQCNMFVVSDGHWTDRTTLMNAVQAHSQNVRIFTLGVSDTANRHALRSLARVGAGAFEFFDRKAKSKWEGRIKGQLLKASQPSLSSIEVIWQQFNDDDGTTKLMQAPKNIMALFNGCRQVVYGFVPNCTQATLKAVINNQEISTVVSTSDLSVTTGKILHQLTARGVIQDWQDGILSNDCLEQQIAKKKNKNYIIKLSIDYSIVTEFTSFIAIETREKDEVYDVSTAEDVNKLVEKDAVDILSYISWETEKEVAYSEKEASAKKEHFENQTNDELTVDDYDSEHLAKSTVIDEVDDLSCFMEEELCLIEKSIADLSMTDKDNDWFNELFDSIRCSSTVHDETHFTTQEYMNRKLPSCFGLVESYSSEDHREDYIKVHTRIECEDDDEDEYDRAFQQHSLKVSGAQVAVPPSLPPTAGFRSAPLLSLQSAREALPPQATQPALALAGVAPPPPPPPPTSKRAASSALIPHPPLPASAAPPPPLPPRKQVQQASSIVQKDTAGGGRLGDIIKRSGGPRIQQMMDMGDFRDLMKTAKEDTPQGSLFGSSHPFSGVRPGVRPSFGAVLSDSTAIGSSVTGFTSSTTSSGHGLFGSSVGSADPVRSLPASSSQTPLAFSDLGGVGFSFGSGFTSTTSSGHGLFGSPVSFGSGSIDFSNTATPTGVPCTGVTAAVADTQSFLDASFLFAQPGGPPRVAQVDTIDLEQVASTSCKMRAVQPPPPLALARALPLMARSQFGSERDGALQLYSSDASRTVPFALQSPPTIDWHAPRQSGMGGGAFKSSMHAARLSQPLKLEELSLDPDHSVPAGQFTPMALPSASEEPAIALEFSKMKQTSSSCMASLASSQPLAWRSTKEKLHGLSMKLQPSGDVVATQGTLLCGKMMVPQSAPDDRGYLSVVCESASVSQSAGANIGDELRPLDQPPPLPSAAAQVAMIPTQSPPISRRLSCRLYKKRRSAVEPLDDVVLSSPGGHSSLIPFAGKRLGPEYILLKIDNIMANIIMNDDNNDAYWNLDLTLQYLNIDYKVCYSALVEAGLLSLGENPANEVCRLLATLIVLVLIYGWTRSTFEVASLKSLLRGVQAGHRYGCDRGLYWLHLSGAASYVLRVDDRRPLVYSTLQLGRSWADVVLGFLGESGSTDVA